MNTKLTLLVVSSSLVLATPALLAQNTNTNTLPLTQTVKYQAAFEKDRSLGERCLLPPGLKEKLKLTAEQRTDLKPIEKDFAKTSREYQAANQPRIDAAQESNRQARLSKDTAQNSGRAQPVATRLGRSPALPRGSRQTNQAPADAGATRGPWRIRRTNGAKVMPLKRMIRLRIESYELP